MPRRTCLDRPTLIVLARGECLRNRLPRVSQHLSTCSRCRAAVVGFATGTPVALGDTVDERPASFGRALKAAPVAVALVLSGPHRLARSGLGPAHTPLTANPAPVGESAVATVPTMPEPEPEVVAPEAPASPLPPVRSCPPEPMLPRERRVRPSLERLPELRSDAPVVAFVDGRRIRTSL
jgi:hypothetical protein